MPQLAWNWLAAPYVACCVTIVVAGLTATLVRGDRVLRLGLLGATASALPWAACAAVACCTDDADLAARVLRVGVGPVALVGPDILLVLLGVSGQLERYRVLARVAAVGGGVLLIACWFTDWTVAGARRLPSGIFYMEPGPLTSIHMAQLGAWILTGLVIARRATPSAERRRMVRLLVLVVVLVGIGGTDSLILYSLAGSYPIAWLPIGIACVVGTYMAVRTDFLRPRGFDRGALAEVGAFVVASLAIGGLALFVPGASPLPFAASGAVIWVIATASAWAVARRYGTPASAAGVRVDELVATIAELATEADIAEEIAGAWRDAIGIQPMTAWRADPATFELTAITGGDAAARWTIDRDAATWLAQRAEPVATIDLATIRLGKLRPAIEALGHAHGATLLVPLVDRGELAGLIEARYDRPLREGERALVSASALAAARQLAFVQLAEAAAREGETAREVEVAEAMRVSASRQVDDALGDWAVTTAYRNRDAGARGGASWSASLMPDGRLALLVAEAHGPGLVAALGTAALTGAFSAATLDATTLDAVLASLRGAADGMLHEPVAAFVALLDRAGRLEWGTAGHPGGHVVSDASAVALGGGGNQLGVSAMLATRGTVELPAGALLVIGSTALRGADDDAWLAQLRDLAPAGGKLAQLAVERAASRDGDLLAVVVRHR
jgi:GAF domain-containing protein|nr:SpoIIE family protein phosphatase [Kofleriaceae bacterium]